MHHFPRILDTNTPSLTLPIRTYHFHTMKSTIDRAGRIVIPKPLRDRLGLTGGETLDIRERDGRIEIEPVATPMALVEREGRTAAVPEGELPPLTDDLVRETLERTRR
jgi:AbrB family looped-hinge helix DNA binding protein